jgi:hypothetical protein
MKPSVSVPECVHLYRKSDLLAKNENIEANQSQQQSNRTVTTYISTGKIRSFREKREHLSKNQSQQ